MTSALLQQVIDYRVWRDETAALVGAYQSWLGNSRQAEAAQARRLGDLVQSLENDRLMLAFVAEFSRGKTELINALFFSDFKQRLLPSDAGRTTMCPTEIFHDAGQPPYLRLLPIESRVRDESIETLKSMPTAWRKLRLDPSSPEQMLEAMQHLSGVKTVTAAQARELGLWDEEGGADSEVEIPAFRYAMINYPHPLLDSGLVILDTPGLNALGTEPELTLSTIPNAHAVVFLLAADSGVTKSDLEIWSSHVQKHTNYRLAVLNKIDVLWDELKTPEQIEVAVRRQIEGTAKKLDLPYSHVLALSAQKALVAKIRGDADLLEKSGIAGLENLIAREILPAKREILQRALLEEVGTMTRTSQHALRNELASIARELHELGALTGKNRAVVKKLHDEVLADKANYAATVKGFTITRQTLTQRSFALTSHLSPQRLDRMLEKSRTAIRGRLTTGGLMRGMQQLFAEITAEFDQIHQLGLHLRPVLAAAYQHFYEKYGFEKLAPPDLDLERHRQRLHDLVQKTDEFCHDPVNLMTEKHLLVNKFYLGLVTQARQVFDAARADSEAWIGRALDPLLMRIRERKTDFERRLTNIKKIHDNIDTLQERITWLEDEQARLTHENSQLDEIMGRLRITA